VSDYAGLKTKTVEVPGPDHPITIERNAHRIVVTVAGRVVADTQDALTLREASYAPVQYIPRKDVDLTLLERTDHATYCPYKGDCAYFSIHRDGSPQRWMAPARPTTWTRRTEPRSGWRRATSRPQRRKVLRSPEAPRSGPGHDECRTAGSAARTVPQGFRHGFDCLVAV
jgi:uncharacterized protein (DUF427 family)